MTPNEFKQQLHNLSELMVQNLPTISEKMAVNAYAMMKSRVINEGTIGENKNLGEYSDNKLPSFFFKGKAANNSGETFYEKAKKSGEGISYKEWREANNRPTDHVTLSFTGTTFNDIGVVKQLVEGTKVVTIVASKNTKNRSNGKSTSEITSYLKDQYGDFLQPNQQEEKVLQQFLDNEVNKLIKQAFK